jgi:hypothetical protein
MYIHVHWHKFGHVCFSGSILITIGQVLRDTHTYTADWESPSNRIPSSRAPWTPAKYQIKCQKKMPDRMSEYVFMIYYILYIKYYIFSYIIYIIYYILYILYYIKYYILYIIYIIDYIFYYIYYIFYII